MFNVFIQWHENSSRHGEFDGGLERVGTPHATVKDANRAAAGYLFCDMSSSYFWFPFTHTGMGFRHTGLQLGVTDETIVIDFNSNEPASVDFGDGTIYVAEVVE